MNLSNPIVAKNEKRKQAEIDKGVHGNYFKTVDRGNLLDDWKIHADSFLCCACCKTEKKLSNLYELCEALAEAAIDFNRPT